MRSFIFAALMILAVAGTAAAATEADLSFSAGVQRACGVVLAPQPLQRLYNFDRAPQSGDGRVVFRDACKGFADGLAAEVGRISFSKTAVNGYGQTVAFDVANYCMAMGDFEYELTDADALRLGLMVKNSVDERPGLGSRRTSTPHVVAVFDVLANKSKLNMQFFLESAVKASDAGVSNLPIQRFVSAIMVRDFKAARQVLNSIDPVVSVVSQYCRNIGTPDSGKPAFVSFDAVMSTPATAPATDLKDAEIAKLKAENEALKKQAKKKGVK